MLYAYATATYTADNIGDRKLENKGEKSACR